MRGSSEMVLLKRGYETDESWYGEGKKVKMDEEAGGREGSVVGLGLHYSRLLDACTLWQLLTFSLLEEGEASCASWGGWQIADAVVLPTAPPQHTLYMCVRACPCVCRLTEFYRTALYSAAVSTNCLK